MDQSPASNPADAQDTQATHEPVSVIKGPRNHRSQYVACGLLLALAVVCVTRMGYEQIRLFNLLGNELPRLEVYRQMMAPVSTWAQQTGTQEIGYLQTTPASRAGPAKDSMTRYMLAPLLLRPPSVGYLLINFDNESQQAAFEESQNCHALVQFAPGVAVMEKNQ